MRSLSRLALVAAAPMLLLPGCGVADNVLGTPRADQTILLDVSLTRADASPDATFAPYDGGDDVAGRVTLDLCAADYPSESQRRARHQVQIFSDAGSGSVSSEALVYSSGAAAEQAMAELASAVAGCPAAGSGGSGNTEAVILRSADDQELTWTFEDAPDRDWPQTPGVQRQAYDFVVADSFGDSFRYISTYLRRGRVLVAVYVTPPGLQEDVIRNSPTLARFIEVLSARLAGLPDADVR